MGQRWAAALEPNWYPTGSGDEHARTVVYCHTSRMTYPNEWQTRGWCNLFDTEPSWERCSKCGENEGFFVQKRPSYPSAPTACPKGDLDYLPEDPRCHSCGERPVCVGAKLRRSARVRLVVLG